ncbi:MAG: helix-turn-helix transcriptional regulator [Muribaculaceae bacterium]|nr:helix-turn-helix transcriptional regulator [Muribaculaceae bacterium]MDE7420280.1 helix-turn-helix transcriptional regulator [Muribaculaceae bacterium]
MTNLAKYIKAKRKEFGISQVELSQKSGVGLRFIREMEQGKETMRMDKVNQVLALFGDELAPRKIESSMTQQKKLQLQSLLSKFESILDSE